MKKIGVWGDSITRGALDEDEGGWVNRLRNHLNYLESKPQIYNLGINGEKVKDILSRFKREYNELGKPDVVIIAIGINDSPHESYKGTPLEVFRKRYEELVRLSGQRAHQTILIGLTNVLENHPAKHDHTNGLISEYDKVIKDLAKKHGLLFVDLHGLISKQDLQSDGLHPEEKGHQIIYKQVSQALKI